MAPDDNKMDVPTDTLAETENFVAWVSHEPDGEDAFHIELGQVTIHFFKEEWDELLVLMNEVLEGSKK